jgi:hypothetical protein
MTTTQTITMPPPIHVNLKPLGTYKYGGDFLKAAEDFAGRPMSVVPHFLRCQAIELGLKAFLLLKSVAALVLTRRPYGHDLSALLDEAQKRGLSAFFPIESAEVDTIRLANDFYDSGPRRRRRFQYFEVAMIPSLREKLPDATILQQIASKLVRNDQLEQAYLRGRDHDYVGRGADATRPRIGSAPS